MVSTVDSAEGTHGGADGRVARQQQASDRTRWSLEKSIKAVVVAMAVSMAVTFAVTQMWWQRCVDNDIVSNWNVPKDLQPWQHSSLSMPVSTDAIYAQQESFIQLPATQETLFWAPKKGRTPRSAELYRISKHSPVPKLLVEVWSDRPSSFTLIGNDTACFEGGTETDFWQIGCYFGSSGTIQFVPDILGAVDPISYNGQLWFRGKGSENKPEIQNWHGKKLYYVYVFDPSTRQTDIKGFAVCSNALASELYEWCSSSVRSNADFEDQTSVVKIMENLQEWTATEDRCNATVSFLWAIMLLFCTIRLASLLLPEVFLCLLATNFVAFLVSVPVLLSDPFLVEFVLAHTLMIGFVYLLVGVILHEWTTRRLSRVSTQHPSSTKTWSVALLRVGTVMYTSGMWSTADGVGNIFFVTIPLLLLHRHTSVQICLAAAIFAPTNLLDVHHVGSLLVAVVGAVFMAAGLWFVHRSVLKAGAFMYAFGIWSIAVRDDIGIWMTLLLNLFGFIIPLLTVATVANDSTVALLASAGLLLQFMFLMNGLLMEFLAAIGESANLAGHVFCALVAVVAMVSTCTVLSEGCGPVLRPRQLVAVLWRATHDTVPGRPSSDHRNRRQRMSQRQMREEEEGREQELPLMRGNQ